jgi:hypothetical protein
MKSFLNFALASVVGLVALDAKALDVVQVVPPQTIADSQLKIGSRVLRLPEGNWNFVAQKRGDVTNTNNNVKIGTTFRAYAMNVKDSDFVGGIQLLLPESSFFTNGWRPEPCKVDNVLYKNDFNSGFSTPECLIVFKRISHLRRPTDEFYSQASQWAVNEKIKLSGSFYEIVYTKYATNDFGNIRIWIPVSSVGGDEAAIEWAQTLPDRLKRLFEGRDSEAVFPSLPFKPQPN